MEEQYNVVVNSEEQYSIWPEKKSLPAGWNFVGFKGSKENCLDHIQVIWTDMRPLSLRKSLEKIGSEKLKTVPTAKKGNLVEALCQDQHIVLFDSDILSFKDLEERLGEKFLYLYFPNTKGGTSIGMGVDHYSFEKSGKNTNQVHILGHFSLDYTNIRCSISVEMGSMKALASMKKIETAV